jgi:hypothetical protein
MIDIRVRVLEHELQKQPSALPCTGQKQTATHAIAISQELSRDQGETRGEQDEGGKS